MTLVRIVAAKCAECGTEMSFVTGEDGELYDLPAVTDARSLHDDENECGYCGGQVMVVSEPLHADRRLTG